MMKTLSKSFVNWPPCLLLVVFFVECGRTVEAYDFATHRAIAERGVDVSLLDEQLKTQLGFPDGKAERFLGESARDRIASGAEFEDIPSRRVLNHFHNPLQPWDQAGLQSLFTEGQSSVLWQQNPDQDTTTVRLGLFRSRARGGNWSWQNARQHHLEALTGELPEQREKAFAVTFQALGQLTHLVQDASVPAHVRNDPHPPGLNSDWYEDWVEEIGTRNPILFQSLLNRLPVHPLNSMLTPTLNTQAPVPIARLIDSDTFLGRNGDLLKRSDIGIAEYTNGNFLSRDTIFEDFALPRPPNPAADFLEPEDTLFGRLRRRYFRKTGEGELIDHFVAEGLLYIPITETVGVPLPSLPGLSWPSWILTDRVHEDYARFLFPRAVGYSAGLLDYFFRGRLDVDVVANAVNPAQLELRVINRSPEALGGPATVSIHCDSADGTRTELPGKLTLTQGQEVPAGAEFPPIPFSRPGGTERCMAVYAGKLGDEVPVPNTNPALAFPGAVIGKVFGQPVEVVFIGAVNGVNGFYLSSDKGVFRIAVRDQPPSFSNLDSISWGLNDNVILVLYRPTVSAFPGSVFQIHRINRATGRSEIPVTGTDPQTGLEFLDTTVLAEFPERPDFPLPGTMTTEVTVHAHRRLAGTTFEQITSSAGPVATNRTDFIPLAEDTVGPFVFSGSTDMNLNNSLMAEPSALAASPIHAFVDESNELIMLYEIRWSPGELVKDQAQEVFAYGTLPEIPTSPVPPDTFCSQLPRTFSAGFSQPAGSLDHFLAVSATLACKVLVVPTVSPDAPHGLKDYALVNRTTGQILAKSFDNPTFRWQDRVEVLTGFQTVLTRDLRKPAATRDDVGYSRFVQIYLTTTRSSDVVTEPSRARLFNLTTSGRGLFGITVEPPFIHTPVQTIMRDQTLRIDNVFTRFLTELNPEERELNANEEEFGRQAFPLRNRGGLILLARSILLFAPITQKVVRLPLPAQPGAPVVAKVLTGPVTPLGGAFRNPTIIEAHETAAVVKFRSLLFPNTPVERAFFITEPNDTVREVVPTDFAEGLRLLGPNAFLDETNGRRKEQTPVLSNGTVTFTQNAIPEKDLLAAGTFPNVTALAVKSFQHKPQWHLVGGGP